MKKIIIALLTINMGFSLFSYNPPVSADNLYELSSARQISNGSSSAGGALFYANPHSASINPALIAEIQRTGLNLGYTALISSNEANKTSYANAFQVGTMIPFKWAAFSSSLSGIMIPFEEMNLGNTINVKFALAKEITDKINVGLSLNSGFFWGANTDWSLSSNLGFTYACGKFGFLDDLRFGFSLLNLGKNYSNTTLNPINTEKKVGAFPMIGTIKMGTAALLLNKENIKIGASFDLTIPAFMNLIADLALQFTIKEFFYVSLADRFNMRELINNHVNVIPSISFGFRFNFDVKNNDYLQKKGWNESEMSLTTAWKQMYESVNCFSTEVDVELGMEDKTPPVIELWIDEEE